MPSSYQSAETQTTATIGEIYTLNTTIEPAELYDALSANADGTGTFPFSASATTLTDIFSSSPTIQNGDILECVNTQEQIVITDDSTANSPVVKRGFNKTGQTITFYALRCTLRILRASGLEPPPLPRGQRRDSPPHPPPAAAPSSPVDTSPPLPGSDRAVRQD